MPRVPRLLRTASFRLAALYLVLFVLSSCVLGAAVFVSVRSEIDGQMTSRIQAEAELLSNEFRSGGIGRMMSLVRDRGRGASALDYLIEDAAGARLAGALPLAEALHPGWMTVEIAGTPADDTKSTRLRMLVTRLDGGVLLAVGDDLDRINEVQEAIARALAWAIGLAALLGTGGGILLSRAFLARVDAITRTAEAIIEGDIKRRVPVRGTGDDLDHLASTLNRMLDRIAMLVDSLRQVSSDVAHDLRTPLSRLCQRLDGALRQARSVADYETAVEGAIREAEGLQETFSALLRIAQVAGGSPRDGFRRVDLSAIVETVIDAYRPDLENAGYHLEVEIELGLQVFGDQELLSQATANLIENCLRHTPRGTRIQVSVGATAADGISLVVQDNGEGVSDDDLPRLVQRFYRGEQSRTSPGNGLGLSLVGAVVELHRANFDVRNVCPGLRVVLGFHRAVGD
ncbi:MAG: ATP-binding protein [Azospirillaceae bacterium]|nr:ATP-binding protein [Azospirillaceae bacterium]